MDEIEPPGPNARAQFRCPTERGCARDPNPLDSEAFKREASLLIAKCGKRGDDAVFLHLTGEIEQRPLGTALSERVDDRQDVELAPAPFAAARACGVTDASGFLWEGSIGVESNRGNRG
jgi:hypothetical protein